MKDPPRQRQLVDLFGAVVNVGCVFVVEEQGKNRVIEHSEELVNQWHR
jgi:hypothetical protein